MKTKSAIVKEVCRKKGIKYIDHQLSKKAMTSIERGFQQCNRGETISLGSFAKFAKNRKKKALMMVGKPGIGKTWRCTKKHPHSITLKLAKPLTDAQVERLFGVCCGLIDVESGTTCGVDYITLIR